MIELHLPPQRPGDWLGAIVERHEVAGVPMFRVSIRGRGQAAAERSWFYDRGEALAFAVDRADRRCLPLFDLTGPEPD